MGRRPIENAADLRIVLDAPALVLRRDGADGETATLRLTIDDLAFLGQRIPQFLGALLARHREEQGLGEESGLAFFQPATHVRVDGPGRDGRVLLTVTDARGSESRFSFEAELACQLAAAITKAV